MPDLLEKTGKIVFLRAHDLGTGYGPPTDQLDVEAVFILNALDEGGYGFQLRNDDYLPARQAMFSLLRDAFVHNLTVIADYLIEPGRINGTAIRVALIRQTGPGSLPGALMAGSLPAATLAKKKLADPFVEARG
jgi:hypothetical protein